MSDINRLPPICEACETLYGLTLCACGGGATGDIFLCEPDYAEHLTVCDECQPEGFNFRLGLNIESEGRPMIVGYQSSGITRRQLIVDQLKTAGIVTLADLDKWRATHLEPGSQPSFFRTPSRYKALERIVGGDAADLILNELAILQCTGIGKGRAA